MNESVPEILEQASKLFQLRDDDYGSAYKSHGAIMKAFFPNGIKLESALDFTRFGVFNAIVGKVNREAQNFDRGGHDDSMFDLTTFAAMMLEVDRDAD